MTIVILTVLGVMVALVVVAAARFLRPRPSGLVAGEERLWRAHFAALIETAPWGAEVGIDELVRDVSRLLAAVPGPARAPLRVVTWGFERLPLLVLVSPRRYSALSRQRRLEVLRRAAVSRRFVTAALFEAVQALALIVVSGHPRALAACGLDRPARVAECRAARARELAGSQP